MKEAIAPLVGIAKNERIKLLCCLDEHLDRPEAFGQHPNADIASQIVMGTQMQDRPLRWWRGPSLLALPEASHGVWLLPALQRMP